MDINVGDVLKLKNSIPAAAENGKYSVWGADFRLKCLGCGHQIVIAKKTVRKKM